MPIKTITQIRAENPTVTLADNDLLLLDQAAKTIAATLAQLKDFVRPAEATGAVSGLLSSTDKTKLNQIAANATANQTDTYLLARANHSGVQDIATITGLATALSDLAASINDLQTNKLSANNPAPTGGFAFPKYTFATKPSAAANNGRCIEITDSADGIVICRSNGTDWVKVAIVSADPVEAAP